MAIWRKIIYSGSHANLASVYSAGDITTAGNIIAENYIVKSTTTQMTTSFSEGSTQFGDDTADVHGFTGSLSVIGPLIDARDVDIVKLGMGAQEYSDVQIADLQIYSAATNSPSSSNAFAHNIYLHAQDRGAGSPHGGSISFGGPDNGGNNNRAHIAIAARTPSTETDHVGMQFFTHNSSTSTANMQESMYLTHDGKLGIGTTSPTTKLEVSDFTSQVITDSDTFITNIHGYHNNGLLVHTGFAEGADIARFSAIASGYTENTVMVIKDTGDVGIGTHAPTEALQVEGNISASGDLYIKGLNDANGDYQNVVTYDSTTGRFYYTGSYSSGTGTGGGVNGVGTGLDITDDLSTISLDLTEVTANSGTANAVLTSDGDGTLTAETTLIYDGAAFTSDVSFSANIKADGNIDGDGSTALNGINGAQLGHITSTQDGLFQTRINFASDKTSFNGTGHNIDFNVNGDNINNLLFVDAGNDRVGIRTNAPSNILQINHAGADGDNGLMIVREDSSTLTGNLLGGIGFDSTDGNVPSSILEASAYISAFAAENHSTSDKGAYLTFGIAPINQNQDTVSTERMRIESDGDIHCDQDIIAFSSTTSDRRLKTNIRALSSSLETVCKLEGVRYDWKHRPETNQLGVIAQQVELHVPEVIHETTLPFYAPNKDDNTIYKTVRYEMLVPHLIESIKELKAEIDILKSRLGDS